ncbi:hypothetical protein R1sor_009262 [Riccia sorocarpa]|uniref:NAD-dependent epimerase/dehydratase domain-containing protein n=1 Tax=Riccia sorocarpa TaxID=122646 RepID=A0ABD3HYQ0_9MARC
MEDHEENVDDSQEEEAGAEELWRRHVQSNSGALQNLAGVSPEAERPRNFFLQQADSRPVPRNGFCGENGRRLECAGEEALQNPCPFRIRWKLGKEKTWTISVFASKHVYPSHLHTWRSAADAKWLAEVLANKVTSNPKIGVGQLRDTFRAEYGRQASYKSTWHGREIVLNHIGGCDAKSFQSIPVVCARLKAVHPNGHVEWEPQPDSRAFRRMFVCPSASGRSFPYMRPHVGLDACHSKNQRYPSFIMLATCMDGNNNISILAYAIVDRENEENWRFGTEMEKFFKVLHRCKTEERYKQVLDAITEKNPEYGQYLSNIPPALYVMYAVRRPRFGHSTSNIVEIANSAILPIMSYGPLRMCTELYLYMMEQKAKQHRLSLTLNEKRLTPYAAKYMATQEKNAGRMRSYHCIREGDVFVKRTACGGDVDIGSIPNSTFGDTQIGRDYETHNFNFEELNGTIPDKLSRLAHEHGGITRYIQVSCLGASLNSPAKLYNTKAEGEKVTKENFPEATVLRPGAFVGTEDRLLNKWAVFARKMPAVPIIGDGNNKLQPVHVLDVASAVVAAIKDDGSSIGKAYELGGPDVFTQNELVELMFESIREEPRVTHIPVEVAKVIAGSFEWLKGLPVPTPKMVTFSRHNVDAQVVDMVVSPDALTFKDLGIIPRKLQGVEHLYQWRKGGPTMGTTVGTRTSGAGF